MSDRRRGQAQSGGQPASSRQNEYFVPRDGIDREVITADICRYLGNDALVRPGTYNDDASGRSINGYFITAYRNLTTAMIADLKNDSARWDQERRRHQAGTVRYQDSAIHQRSQFSSVSHSQQTAYPREMDTQTTGYSTPQSGTSGTSYTTSAYPSQAGYSYQTAQPSYSSPTTDPRYSTAPQGLQAGYTTVGGQPVDPAWTAGANYGIRGGYDTDMSDPSMPPPRVPATTPYARDPRGVQYSNPTTQPSGYTYQQPPVASSYAQQPIDGAYGRSNKAGTTYSNSPVPEPQYDDPMTGTGPSIRGAAPQTMPMGTSSSRRERSDRHAESHHDRERERVERSDRGGDRERERHSHSRRDDKPRKGYNNSSY